MYCLIVLALCILACHGASLSQVAPDNGAKRTDSTLQEATCSVDGVVFKPGERKVLGNFTFECVNEGNVIRTNIVACLDDNKVEHPIGDRWDWGVRPFRFALECSKSGGITTRKVVQCFYDSADGQARLEAGQEQKVGNNVVRCERYDKEGLKYTVRWLPTEPNPANTNTNTNTNANANANANTNTGNSQTTILRSEPLPPSTNTQEPTCYIGGEKLRVGQRKATENFMYECQRVNDNMVRSVIVACMDDNKPQVAHPHSDQWVEGKGTYQYVFECTRDGEKTMKRAVNCAYVTADGRVYRIDTGREETVDKYVVRCDKMGDDGVQFHISFSPAYMAAFNANFANTGNRAQSP